MQWILQKFEDTLKLAEALDRLEISYAWHKVVPFVGDLEPEPIIVDPDATVLFGSYVLWRFAQKHGLRPGVFKIRPFVHEKPWEPYLLNGTDAVFATLSELPLALPESDQLWFMRPVDDSKEEPGKVRSAAEIIALAKRVLALDEAELPQGSLRHDTELMLTPPAEILKEWRVWIVDDLVQTYSLYKEDNRVIYRQEIDDDAAAFAKRMVELNPRYAQAYVMDICRTPDDLKILETNCINAAGFYAADLQKIATAIHNLDTA